MVGGGGKTVGGGEAESRHALAWLSSLCRSWVLVARIVYVMTVIGVHGMVVVVADLCIYVLVSSLPRRRLAPQP